MGFIAGGMADGAVNIWDPAKMLASNGAVAPKDALVASVDRHKGPVRALGFNPHAAASNLLASGGADNQIYIIDLSRPSEPNVFAPAAPGSSTHGAEITRCAPR